MSAHVPDEYLLNEIVGDLLSAASNLQKEMRGADQARQGELFLAYLDALREYTLARCETSLWEGLAAVSSPAIHAGIEAPSSSAGRSATL